MIDLTTKLPTTIEVGGNFFNIKTDFREWIKFDHIIRTNENIFLKDFFYLFNGNTFPNANFYDALFKFYSNPNKTPHFPTNNDSGEIIVDYIEDGEYIYADFLRNYNIDLLDIDYLHWHKFNALFRSLPDNSQIKTIMGIRSWEKNNEEYDVRMQRLKDAWSYPRIKSEYEEQKIKEFNDYFK
jgi:Bacteriophage Gp15 protein.